MCMRAAFAGMHYFFGIYYDRIFIIPKELFPEPGTDLEAGKE